MLKELNIENIAVIESADICFSSGLNVLSGETGAGKSIVIDSLNAVLGNRTSRELVRTGTDAARVTAVFEIDGNLSWFTDNDIPQEEQIILQRKLSSDGKSSCRVCGVPVSAAQLRDLATELVDIHGQNDGLRLLDERSHLGFLDRFGQISAEKEEYASIYRTYRTLSDEIRSLSMDEEEKMRLSDTLKYRIDEIEKADLKAGEYDVLTARRDLLRNSEKLRESLNSALQYLNSEENSAISATENAGYFCSRAAAYSPDLEEACTALKDAAFNLKNAYELIEDFASDLNFSPEEYNELEKRISDINRLCRKYSRDEDSLLTYLDECRKKLDELEYSDDRLAKLQNLLEKQKADCLSSAKALSHKRKTLAKDLEERIVAELKSLNMPSVQFSVDFQPISNEVGFNADGCDEVRFVMAANAGMELGRISKVASGGELSRIMLALKNVFAQHDTVGTLIFDEIDTGVSGISASRVAEKLYQVSKDRQVMCVTHLPQIAAMADCQYLVSKSERSNQTYTDVSLLDRHGREKEIARLYGGDNITETTIAAAEEQLISAEKYKEKN